MIRYLARRMGHGVFVLLAVSVLVFSLSYLSGDPAVFMLPPSATPDQLDALRVRMGFDRPVWEQYLDFLQGILTLDFGRSFTHNRDAMQLVFEFLPNTLLLVLATMVVTFLIAVPLGTLAALKHGSFLDRLAQLLALIGQSVPPFLIGVFLILVFTVTLRLLPAFGSPTPVGLIMPALTLGLYATAEMMRILRSSLLDVLSEDYVRTVRAKGAGETTVVARHAMRNAAIPVLTLMTLQVGTLVGGAVITEAVFSYPGIGMLAVQAISTRDFLVVQAIVLVIALLVVLVNIGADVLNTLIDPRIRLAGKSHG